MQNETKAPSTIEQSALDGLGKIIFLSALQVHKSLGPGLLETVYHHAIIRELKENDLSVNTMVPVPLIYKGKNLNKDYIIDILVAEKVIIEIKAIETILPVHEAQLISYLKLADKKLGFLINFNVPLLKEGFKRFVNNF
jgi:GxxExxY protein